MKTLCVSVFSPKSLRILISFERWAILKYESVQPDIFGLCVAVPLIITIANTISINRSPSPVVSLNYETN